MPLWITILIAVYMLTTVALFVTLMVDTPHLTEARGVYILSCMGISLIWPLWAIYYFFAKKDEDGRVA